MTRVDGSAGEDAESLHRWRERKDQPEPRVINKVRVRLTPWLRAFISRSPFVVLATGTAPHGCDASPRGGPPGFVHILDDARLLLPEAPGNRLFQSRENIESSGQVGLLFFIPGVEETTRVNGACRVVSTEEVVRLLAASDKSGEPYPARGLLITVQEAYYHCGRSIRRAKLWDVEAIAANRSDPPLSRRPPPGE